MLLFLNYVLEWTGLATSKLFTLLIGKNSEVQLWT